MKHFNRGISKYANSLHTQLRLGRSFLSAHGFAIGIYNSDLCICSRPETTRHFFTCFLYQEEQRLLHENMSKVIPKFSTYSLKHQIEIFMNGISSDPDPRNISIVFAVQTYILQTKRFNQPPPLISKNVVTGFECIGLHWICNKYFQPPGTQEVL